MVTTPNIVDITEMTTEEAAQALTMGDALEVPRLWQKSSNHHACQDPGRKNKQ